MHTRSLMSDKIDNIVAGLRKSTMNCNRLNHLEGDTWQRINLQKIEHPIGSLEQFLAFLFPAQHRFVPVICAALLGVMVGVSTLPMSANPEAMEIFNFQVFKPEAIALTSITLLSEYP